MALISADANVQICRQVLRVDSATYFLHNVEKVIIRPVTLRDGPVADHRKTTLLHYRKSSLRWAFAFGISLATAFIVGPHSYLVGALAALFCNASIAVILVRTVILIVSLRRPASHYGDYYALEIQSGGVTHRVMVNPDEQAVSDLSRRIIDAIDNPRAEFESKIQNIYFGDTVNQFGSDSIGKIAYERQS